MVGVAVAVAVAVGVEVLETLSLRRLKMNGERELSDKTYTGGIAISMPTSEPVEVRLQRRKELLLKEVGDIEKALELLEKQPQLLETLNVLRKVGI